MGALDAGLKMKYQYKIQEGGYFDFMRVSLSLSLLAFSISPNIMNIAG